AGTIVLGLARESGGAVLRATWGHGRAADVSALPGRIVEVSCGVDRVAESAAADWPVLEHEAVGAVDLEQLARRVRQVAASSWPSSGRR
ncbi:MAG: hypothetical protein ACXV4A_10470, partial [Actinomycetes bacterium]